MARKPQDNPQLDMTPMIDVVFELIIFFVVTIKQEDLFAKLNANRLILRMTAVTMELLNNLRNVEVAAEDAGAEEAAPAEG